jgi:predicted N-acetyltransferase YhbS
VPAVQIRRAGAEDLQPALELLRDAFGLPSATPPTVHTFVAGLPSGQLFVAIESGCVVGTGACVSFGSTGWIGGIAVASSARGAGLGRALTLECLSALRECQTVLLMASDAGRPIYDRLGFEPEERFRVFLTGETIDPATDGAFRALTPADHRAVLALDARITGEDRSAVVVPSLDGAVALPDLSAVALRPPFRARPILASDPEGAAALLRAVVEPRMRLAAPESNVAAVSTMASLGAERDGVVRMRLGPRVEWRPLELWGVFALFFG